MNDTKLILIEMIANQRAQTNIGGSYTVYLQGDRYYLKEESSFRASQEITLLELGRMLAAEPNYNLTPAGRLIRFDPRWQLLFHRAEADNLDRWDETGDEMNAVKTLHEALREELRYTNGI